MSWQDTLMNVVYLTGDEPINVHCSWCETDTGGSLIGWADNIDDANTMKITHENDHGIYMRPDTGEYWYDEAEDQGLAAAIERDRIPYDPMDDIPWGTPDSWIPDNPDENGMRMSDFI